MFACQHSEPYLPLCVILPPLNKDNPKTRTRCSHTDPRPGGGGGEAWEETAATASVGLIYKANGLNKMVHLKDFQ